MARAGVIALVRAVGPQGGAAGTGWAGPPGRRAREKGRTEVESGAVVSGRYRLDRRLGRGGMGEVWAAEDSALGRSVAIKIVLADLAADPGLIVRLRREARTAAALQHPGITVVHDIGEHDGRPYFVMELLDGQDFNALLTEHPDGVPLALAVDLMAQVAEALDHAHSRGVVHRDMKPANLMRLPGGGVKICDFGIARYAEATTHLTATGSVLGTPAFMAPEQWLGEQLTAATDLYAFGVTLHTLLTGSPPFPGPTAAALLHQHLNSAPSHVRDVRPDVPSELDDLLQQLLAKTPAERPATAARAREVLQAVADHSARASLPASVTVPQANSPVAPTLELEEEREHEPERPSRRDGIPRPGDGEKREDKERRKEWELDAASPTVPSGGGTTITNSRWSRTKTAGGTGAQILSVAFIVLGVLFAVTGNADQIISGVPGSETTGGKIMAVAVIGALMGGFFGGLIGSLGTPDSITVDGEKLVITRDKGNQVTVRWDTLEGIAVEEDGSKAALVARFRSSRRPAAKWRTANDVELRADGSHVIYGPTKGNSQEVDPTRLRAALERYAGGLYDNPDDVPDP
ncbi:serine/threonine-protein kinase [Streptomyces bugieae]|uniref:non-specific serine/threonine protein kinase n=1 Tax=Streptomyces bugieae TaxID=3098223 RepID=A0ABU7NU89_9ACTN|nr:serine/threonine-protein kinase [Streptomyces sp. DSM 41528]